MKKRILCAVVALFMLCPLLSMLSCGSSEPDAGTVTRMTVDINPSVEFMIDDQNKVVSVTALNDDGSLIIAGEAFVGLSPEEAAKLVVSIATETGYLVKGSVEADENNVKISVSGNTGYAKKLADSVKSSVKSELEKHGVKGKVEKVEALKTDALRELALSTSIYTEAELAEMDDAQLCKVIAAGRIETALLLTDELRDAYYAAKEYEISFAESEATAAVIEAMGGLNQLTYTAYKAALTALGSVITELDELRYSALVDPDSDYQKSLEALRAAKDELLKQKVYTASLEINGQEYVTASATLQLKEDQYETALAAYEAIGDTVNSSLQLIINKLKEAETALKALEDKFSDDIKQELKNKATELEASVNAAKDGFFDKFEKAYSDDIAAIENSLKARKQELISSVEASSAK